MEGIIHTVWQWLQSAWVQSDLASWLAVVLALMAVFFALRKPVQHTELSNMRLQFDTDGGLITLEVDLSTYSHAYHFNAEAKLKMDGLNYLMKLEPVKSPTNYQFATMNVFNLRFVGQYVNYKTTPKVALVDVKARLSDGSHARLRKKIALS